MGSGKKGFQSGNPGKPKGAQAKTTKAAKEAFVGIMEGQVQNVQKALMDLYVKDKEAYLNCLAKFFPYFIPKMTEISGSLEATGGLNLTVVKRVTTTPQIKEEDK